MKVMDYILGLIATHDYLSHR